MSRKIEEFLLYLVDLGFLHPSQPEEMLGARRTGDTRGFGEIALEREYLHDDSVKRLLDFLEKRAENEEQWLTSERSVG